MSPPPPAGRAVPSLGPFAELLGQPYQRLKVAVLRELAGLPEPSWSLARAAQALTWLDPATGNRLLSELRADGLVVPVERYGPAAGPPAWRLSDQGHLVATVSAVLAAPAAAPERAVKLLAAAMSLARTAGVDDRAAFAPFVAATAVLERDLAGLHRLIDQGADDQLAAAAELAAVHLADLGEMARMVARPGGHEAERERAAAVAGRLRTLVDEVLGSPSGDQPLPASVAGADPVELAALVGGRLRRSPAVAPVRAGQALAALDEYLGRPEPVVVPLPEPTLLTVESPEVVPDFVLLAADVITWLAGPGGNDLARWVVGGTWAEATARMAAVVEAWSRWGPAGDGSLAAELDPRPQLEVVGHDEVGVVSRTEVRRVLLVGSVAAADLPELGDPETREEVQRRLAEAGCELAYSAGSERWLARLDGPVPALEGHAPVLALGTAELAVLGACWLHLRFLPAEARSSDGAGEDAQDHPGQGWLDPDDLAELLGARLDGTGLPGVLERLARAGYLTLREGRVEAGPLLDTLDEPGAAEQARALVSRHQRLAHLRRRAAELDGEPAAAEQGPGGSQDDAAD